MKLSSLFLFFVGLALASCHELQYGAMIKYRTGKSVLSYKDYGCSCSSWIPRVPLDATDRCCQAHRCCYEKLNPFRCSAKKVHYNYQLLGNQIICGAGTWCQKSACECDRAAAECLRRAAGTYQGFLAKYRGKCKIRTSSC